MKKSIISIVVLLVTLNSSCQNKESSLFLEKDPNVLLEQLITENAFIGASAGYTIDGKTVWQSSAGYADKKTSQPFEQDTKVRMASIAKSMTALATMQLVEKNLIDLDVPIQTYVPEYPKQPKTQITTRHLLSHTSGIGGYKNGKEAETQKNYPKLSDALELFKNRTLLFEPGTQYSYTTYGYTLLGVIIERTSGLTYEAYMQKNIWNKADMKDTGVAKFGIKIDKASSLYQRNSKGKIREGKENNLSNRVPGGGFYTTVGDMLKFGNAVLKNTFVKEETLNLMRQHHSLEKEKNGYGFGWFLYSPKPNEGDVIGHSGGQTGCTSQLFINPKKGIVVVVLANTSRANEATGLAVQMIHIASSKL